MEHKEMCRIMHPYTCPSCGSDMLFFTRNRNIGVIDYKHLIDTKSNDEIMDYLAEKNIEYLKCTICKKMFIIDWTHGYARPLLHKDILKKFGYKFKE